jgi:hypothetical protein
MENTVLKTERSAEDAAAVKESLLQEFPFLAQHASLVDLLSKWDEWYVGVLDDDVDPADYDSFSLSPLEELHWRTEWKEVGFFTVAIFSVNDAETDVVVCASFDSNLYLWQRNEGFRPVVCPWSLQQILDAVERRPQEIREFLEHALIEARSADPQSSW